MLSTSLLLKVRLSARCDEWPQAKQLVRENIKGESQQMDTRRWMNARAEEPMTSAARFLSAEPAKAV
jgi:hypothetical protein